MQQPFDPDRLEVAGDATPVAEDVFYNPGVGLADFTVSNSGVLAFRSSSNRGNQFAWFDRAGKLLETVGLPGNYRTPDLSPDGQWLAYGDVNRRDVWIFDLARQTSSRFTTGPGSETAPVWFPDGTKIAYRTDQRGMFEKDVTSTGAERVLLAQPVNGPVRSPRTASGSCTLRSRPAEIRTCTCCRLPESASPNWSCRRRFQTSSRNSPRTCAGSRTPRAKTEETKSTSRRFRRPDGADRSRTTADVSRSGAPTAKSSSSSAMIGSFTPSTCPPLRAPDRSNTACPSFSSTCARTSSTRATVTFPAPTESASS